MIYGLINSSAYYAVQIMNTPDAVFNPTNYTRTTYGRVEIVNNTFTDMRKEFVKPN